MHTCPLLRAMPRPHEAATWRRTPLKRLSADKRHRLTLAASLAGWLSWLGWRGLQDVLDAIPDSNDDFGLF